MTLTTIYAFQSNNVYIDCDFNGESKLSVCSEVTIDATEIIGNLTIKSNFGGIFGSRIFCPFDIDNDDKDLQRCRIYSMNPGSNTNVSSVSVAANIYAVEGLNDVYIECNNSLYYDPVKDNYIGCLESSIIYCRADYLTTCTYDYLDSSGTNVSCSGSLEDETCLDYKITIDPTNIPTNMPSTEPTALPSSVPSTIPTNGPSTQPTKIPSSAPLYQQLIQQQFQPICHL